MRTRHEDGVYGDDRTGWATGRVGEHPRDLVSGGLSLLVHGQTERQEPPSPARVRVNRTVPDGLFALRAVLQYRRLAAEFQQHYGRSGARPTV